LNDLQNKNFLVMGVANKWSIAWGIAKVLTEHGGNVVYTYNDGRGKEDILKLTAGIGVESPTVLQCDVSSDSEIESVFAEIKKEYGILHGVVHCIAHSKKEELKGNYYDTSRDGYHLAQDISAYSFVSVCKHSKELMTEGGGIVTLTYLGGERVVKNYNVMGVAKAALEASVKYIAHDMGESGIRVNAISAGPIKTLAAKGIGDFNELARQFTEKAPMRRLVTAEEVGNTAYFLLSPMSSGITGENIHVDCGYSILGY
jgi:enoyl-[acyl-carrier protein] reductase I